MARTHKARWRRDSSRGSALLLLLTITPMLAGCGANAPTNPTGDFSVVVLPGSVSTVDEFTGTVNISLQGIPAGVIVMPAVSFSPEAGAANL